MELWFWIAVVVGAIVLAVILREVLCWYWKIKQIRDLLADIRDQDGSGKKYHAKSGTLWQRWYRSKGKPGKN